MARPPSTYEGRTSTGYPMRFALASASSTLVAVAPRGCGMASSSSSLPKRLRSSARSMLSGEVPMMGTPAAFSGSARFSGVCPPNCTITPIGSAARRFVLVHRHHVFVGQRLEVEAVAGVVVGRDGLGIAVDHDRLVAVFAQREGRVAAAVVELDSLPDAVGPAAQDDDLLAVGRRRLVLVFVGRVEVRRVALELGGAGVHALVHRRDAVLLAKLMDLLGRSAWPFFICSASPRRASEKPMRLSLAQALGVDRLAFPSFACTSEISFSWCRNQGSMLVICAISRTLMPCASA